QLDEVAATVDGAVANAVQYDDADKDSITLAGADGTTIDNLADGRIGSGSQQAINGGQLYGSLDSVAAILGGGATVTAIGTISAPTYTVQGGDYFSVADALGALDASLTDFGDRLTVVEGGGSTGGNGADKRIAIGGQDSATIDSGTNAVAVGSDAGAKGENGTALGGGAHAAGRNDTAVGGNAWVGADGSTAVGANAHIDATATNAVAVGEGASVSAASGTAIGQGASVTAEGAVALGQGSVADRAGTVSVGSAGNERQITNVAAGTEATDAVNKGQLDSGVADAKAYTDTTATQTLTSANAYTDNKFA